MTPALLMWTVVFAVGVPSAWRNPTAAALVLAKIAGWGWYQITGDNLPVEFYLFPDIFVLAVIMAKNEHCNLRPYRGRWHQLKCVLLERSPADRFIILTFAAMWVLYVAPLHPYYVWWSLYWLVIAQFLAAGSESLARFIASRRKPTEPQSIIDRHLKVIQFPTRDADAAPAYLGLKAVGGGGSG